VNFFKASEVYLLLDVRPMPVIGSGLLAARGHIVLFR